MLGLGAVMLVSAITAGTAWGAAVTTRVTLRSSGNEVNADADFPATSGNGRYISFESVGHFVPGDTGPHEDVFVRDIATGKTTKVSIKSNEQSAPFNCADSAISNSGRFVAFTCDGPLVGSDTNEKLDVYVRDRKNGTTQRMSVKTNGNQVAADSQEPDISGDGRYVVFKTDGKFVPGDTNATTGNMNPEDVYIHDRRTGATNRISVDSQGHQRDLDSGSLNPAISDDGRFVAWQSYGKFTEPDYQFAVDSDIFVRDRENHTTARASLKSDGSEADPNNNVSSSDPAISADGKFVAFEAQGAYVDGDTNNKSDIYVKNMSSGGISRVSIPRQGGQSNDESQLATISASGRFVAFESYAKLSGTDTNTGRDIYLRDRKLKETRRISLRTNGKQVDGYEHQLPSISADGRYVAFSSMGKFTPPGTDAGLDFDCFRRGPLF
jgi:hypothetical protein